MEKIDEKRIESESPKQDLAHQNSQKHEALKSELSKAHTLAQKILLYILYGLIFLMIIFSFLAMNEKDYAGYEKCVQKKCQRGGEAFCNKAREQNNCCLGAGGQLATTAEGKYTCVFS